MFCRIAGRVWLGLFDVAGGGGQIGIVVDLGADFVAKDFVTADVVAWAALVVSIAVFMCVFGRCIDCVFVAFNNV